MTCHKLSLFEEIFLLKLDLLLNKLTVDSLLKKLTADLFLINLTADLLFKKLANNLLNEFKIVLHYNFLFFIFIASFIYIKKFKV